MQVTDYDLDLGSYFVYGASMLALNDGIPVELGGTLRIVEDEVWNRNVAFRLFAWPGTLDPSNQFSSVEIPAGAWDLSTLYTDWTITFLEFYARGSGDFDVDEQLTAADIDRLSLAMRGGGDLSYDLNADSLLNAEDHRIWVEDLAGTYFGDADLNQEVDFGDFLALSRHFGAAGGWAEGDFDGSGDVQFNDFLLLSDNFGNQPTAAAVPEPTLGLSLFLGFLIAIRFRLARNCPFRCDAEVV
jgi:hypothetical protein